jgi:hypothetical protein
MMRERYDGLSDSEAEADRSAHAARVAILAGDCGYYWTRFVFRALQWLRLYPRAYSVDNRPLWGPHSDPDTAGQPS